MPDEDVDRWVQEGRLYLWRYTENTRNYSGWHLTADDVCCQSLADLIGRMLSARWGSQKTLAVTPPTKEVLGVPNNRGGRARWEAPGGLLLKYPKGAIGDEYSELEERGGRLILSAGRQQLELLKECVLKVPRGEGDYAITVGETSLWFWWMPR
jgi:hypothetical protein